MPAIRTFIGTCCAFFFEVKSASLFRKCNLRWHWNTLYGSVLGYLWFKMNLKYFGGVNHFFPNRPHEQLWVFTVYCTNGIESPESKLCDLQLVWTENHHTDKKNKTAMALRREFNLSSALPRYESVWKQRRNYTSLVNTNVSLRSTSSLPTTKLKLDPVEKYDRKEINIYSLSFIWYFLAGGGGGSFTGETLF